MLNLVGLPQLASEGVGYIIEAKQICMYISMNNYRRDSLTEQKRRLTHNPRNVSLLGSRPIK